MDLALKGKGALVTGSTTGIGEAGGGRGRSSHRPRPQCRAHINTADKASLTDQVCRSGERKTSNSSDGCPRMVASRNMHLAKVLFLAASDRPLLAYPAGGSAHQRLRNHPL
jgi:hypothetical protein